MNIGWPEGIWLGLALFGLFVSAVDHGKPRDPYSFPVTLVTLMISGTLLYLGGFFA